MGDFSSEYFPPNSSTCFFLISHLWSLSSGPSFGIPLCALSFVLRCGPNYLVMAQNNTPPLPEGIFSLLDTDLYKLTMQCAVLKYFPDVCKDSV